MIPPWRPLGTLSTGKMVVLPLFRKLTCLANKRQASSETGIVKLFYSSDSHTQLPLPSYKPRENESVEKLRARLLYQSRKRGMLENDLLLSNFASKYLHKFNTEELRLYDTLINKPSNDWEIYYWATETNPTPLEYDTEIMKLLKVFTKNKDKSSRVRQPDLYSS